MGLVVSCLNASSRQLLNAAAVGDADTVREILEAKPQLANHTALTTGYNCLHYAAAKGHTAVLQAALEAVRLGTKDAVAEDSGDTSIKDVRAWSKLMKDLLNQRGRRGETPVMVACEEGHGFAARYLIEQGADPFIQDKTFHRSAIHYAAARGKADALRRLLDDNLRIHTEEGFVPLKAARVQDVSGTCRYIDSRAENGLTALHLAANSGSLECVRLLLDGGASMMVRTVDLDVISEVTAPAGSTPLHVAAMSGNVCILQAMLQAHSDALGTWGDNGAAARRAWEGDGRIDLRSVTNCLRQLPYHVAWQKGFRQAAGVLNPTVPIDSALETCRELGEGFGPQKLAVLAAYSLRQGLLVWLKTYKADVELRQNIDPTVGIRAPSMSGRSNTERAAAAAVADAQATGTLNPRATPYPQMDIMHETDSEGILDSAAAAQLASHQQQSGADPRDPFLHGADAAGMGRSQNGRETDALVGVCPPSSRSLQGPNFSSKAFPSFSGDSSFDAPTPPPQQLPGSPFVSDGHAPDASVPHSKSNLSIGSFTSFPRPSRAPPPPPAALVPPASPFISPFAQAAQSAVAAGFPPLERLNSGGSVHSASSEREKRPTVRFADTPTINNIPPATIGSRPYQHTNSGFTELAMSRGASPGPPLPTSQAAAPQTPSHHRSRSDLGQGSRAGPRSVSWNRSMSRQERAASVTLDALELPPLPLPEEAVAGSAGEAVLSRQASRQMSLSTRQLSGFRRSRSIVGRQPSSQMVSRQPSMISRAASIAGFEDDCGGDCGICLDELEQVAINGCNHKLCVDCSISLCEVHKKPPLCPFCRAMISGFHVIPKNKYHVN
ncbi:hypothetical protein ABBQ38_008392 [Trebouxia sp. C0009 RCD-2024]